MIEFRDHRRRHEHALIERRQQVLAADLDEVIEGGRIGHDNDHG
jgi:hypothetical protein